MVRDARRDFGYELPVEVEHYVVLLLADHVDRPHWQPEPSFAETYMTISTSRDAKRLGDACLFMTGVFPERGPSMEYYVNIGSSSYHRAGRELRRDLFDQLARNFSALGRFIQMTTRGLDRLPRR